jgi:DNA ligase-1
MKRFAALFAAIDQTTSTNAKVDAMTAYFSTAAPSDAAWAAFFLIGRRLKRLVPGRAIGQWAIAATGVPEWMLGECYAVVGDGAETATLLLDQLPPAPAEPLSLAEWVEDRVLPLRDMDQATQQRRVLAWVRELDRWERFTFLKILTGELRLGVSQTLAVRALAEAASLPATVMAARLMGDWEPTRQWFAQLVAPGVSDVDRSRPYPFFLASPVDDGTVSAADVRTLLGNLDEWQVEWKWDGIRAQLVKRSGLIHLWSRGEELITSRFPEIVEASATLPDDTVIDGEVLAYRDGRPLPFSALQRRIGRDQQLSRAVRNIPVVFMTYDVLEHQGTDVRGRALGDRRALLETIVADAQRTAPRAPRAGELLLPFDDEPASGESALRMSPIVDARAWDELARLRRESRGLGVEGLMLKRRSSPYGVGRKRGDWWKWKIDPHTIDAVLIYAQPGSGKRASLLTDYTFGLWDHGELVPFAKAYSGLTNDEIAELDRWIRQHTLERFGPVRHVEPVHVFELGFEAIARSTRHRSGIAVRFPRMLRWRKDKPAAEADTLDALKGLLVPE